jgi:hypothetical protein
MAKQTLDFIDPETWTEITDSDVDSITFQNRSKAHVFVTGTGGAAPSGYEGIRYNPGQGERNVQLSDLFPGESATRVWVYAPAAYGAEVFVSHA